MALADDGVGAPEVLLALLGDGPVLHLAGLRGRVVRAVVEELVRGLEGAAPHGLARAADPLQARLDVLCDVGSGAHIGSGMLVVSCGFVCFKAGLCGMVLLAMVLLLCRACKR